MNLSGNLSLPLTMNNYECADQSQSLGTDVQGLDSTGRGLCTQVEHKGCAQQLDGSWGHLLHMLKC